MSNCTHYEAWATYCEHTNELKELTGAPMLILWRSRLAASPLASRIPDNEATQLVDQDIAEVKAKLEARLALAGRQTNH